MSLIWFRPGTGGRTVDQLVQQLAPFGIRLSNRQSFGCCVYRVREEGVLVKEIGELLLTVAGAYSVLPRSDANDSEVALLLRCAERAFRAGRPTRATGWVNRKVKSGTYWKTTILRPLADDEDEQSAFLTAEDIGVMHSRALDDVLPRMAADG